jgi:hypothetical protein
MSRAGWAARVAAALAVFLVSWSVIHHGFLARSQIEDTGLYQQYGDAMAGGEVPYRDFHLEYPPCPSSSCPRSGTRATAMRTTAGSTG